MVSTVASMPVLAASSPMSPTTRAICRNTSSGSAAGTSNTPTDFCAGTAHTAKQPGTPQAVNVRRSAEIPAPPPESVPPIESARGGVTPMFGSPTGPPGRIVQEYAFPGLPHIIRGGRLRTEVRIRM